MQCRACPGRESAWATLQRWSPKDDGSILSSHWLSGTTEPLLALAGLQVFSILAISLHPALAFLHQGVRRTAMTACTPLTACMMLSSSGFLLCRQRRLGNMPQTPSHQRMAPYRPQPCIYALGNPPNPLKGPVYQKGVQAQESHCHGHHQQCLLHKLSICTR